jgi:20S proteasome subunit beta 6
VVASAGMQADRAALHKLLHTRHVTYQFDHRKPMSCDAVAQLLSNTLYYKRFFPFYTFNLCAGLDAEGRGAIYTYDAIGSYERVGYGCQGSGKELVQPVLDNQLRAASPLVLPSAQWLSSLPLETAVDLVKGAFVSAGERDIYTVGFFKGSFSLMVFCYLISLHTVEANAFALWRLWCAITALYQLLGPR